MKEDISKNIIKKNALNPRVNSLLSIYHAESGHPGGVLSSIDIITYLFMKES